MAVVQCARCGKTNCEWWFSLGEIWEDMSCCKYCEEIFCQCCYYKHKRECDARP